MKHGFSKLVLVLLTVAMLAPVAPIAVPRAHAIDAEILLDIPRVAESVLKRAAIIAARTAIQSMTRSIVTWIQSGFHGSPAFATNLGINTRQLADGVALDFLGQLEADASINSPFLSRAITTARTGYLLYSSRDAVAARLKYTLDQYSHDPNAFLRGDFSQGGFNAWMATTWGCGNDPYCAQFVTEDEVASRVNSSVQNWLHEYDAGKGFLSWRCNCADTSDNGWGPNLSDADHTSSCQICTPGSTIETELGITETSPLRQLELADSLDQIIGALASQLISTALNGNGLLGGNGGGGGGNPTTPTIPSTLSANFIEVAQNERDNVASYQTSWQTLRGAASRASQACTLGLDNDPAKASEATTVLAQADTALRKSGDALAALNSIVSRATQAQSLTGGAQSTLVQQVTSDYQCLVSGGTPSGTLCTPSAGTPIGTTCPVTQNTLPNGNEISCALTESQNTGDTLLVHLNATADSGCH